MKKPLARKNASGFTLVEMLVVIAIISLVAGVSVRAIKGAQRQAKASTCAANLHALHQAVMSYKADTTDYPTACAYEWFDLKPDGTEAYYLKRGWVSWVRSSATISRRKSEGNLYRHFHDNDWHDGPVNATKAAQYCYVGPGCGAQDYSGASGTKPNYSKVHLSRIYRSIDEGSIFKYTDKNFSIYCCEEFKAKFGSYCMRSYAMNQVFGNRRSRSGSPNPSVGGSRQASRLAMFVELDESAGGTAGVCNGKAGTSGKATAPTDFFKDDSVWDWDKGENVGAWHRKNGKLYGHVIFADGHLESIIPKKTDEERKDLGDGKYGEG